MADMTSGDYRNDAVRRLIDADDEREIRTILESSSFLVTSEAEAHFAQLRDDADRADDRQTVTRIEDRYELVLNFRRYGTEKAISLSALTDFLRSPILIAGHSILASHPELLNDHFVDLVREQESQAEAAGNEELARYLRLRHQMLLEAKDTGIGPFLQMLTSHCISAELRSVLDELDELDAHEPRDNVEYVSLRAEILERVLALTNPDEIPPVWSYLQTQLAIIHANMFNGDCTENAERALADLRLVADLNRRLRIPADLASALQNIAAVYEKHPGVSAIDKLDIAIGYLAEASTIDTSKIDPMQWAVTRYDLALLYMRSERGERAENVERAVELLTGTLGDAGVAPTLQAEMQVVLARAYLERVGGERAENVERAVELLTGTLGDAGVAPTLQAEMQVVLARAYLERVGGERAENVERAVELLTGTLGDADVAPTLQAEMQVVLARAYLERVGGERAENVERSAEATNAGIQHARVVRSIFAGAQNLHHYFWLDTFAVHLTALASAQSEITNPMARAAVLLTIAEVEQERLAADPADNIEKSLASYRAALAICHRSALPIMWARIQQGLGVAYERKPRGEDEETHDKAAVCFRAALEVFTRDAFPEEWMRAQYWLARTYMRRKTGDLSEQLEHALMHFLGALEVRTEEISGLERAYIHNEVAETYSERLAGDAVANRKRAIAHLQAALKVFSGLEMPAEWAAARHNLEIVTARLVGREAGNQAETGDATSLQEALAELLASTNVETVQALLDRDPRLAGHAALQALRGDAAAAERDGDVEAAAFFSGWLRALLSAGEPGMREEFNEAISGIAAEGQGTTTGRLHAMEPITEDLEEKISALEARLDRAPPGDRGMLSHELANAYSMRVEGSRAENIDRMIMYFEASLEVLTSETMLLPWAITQYNIGIGYSDRINGDRAENLERAISAYEASLTVLTREGTPVPWCKAQTSLGAAYVSRIEGAREDNLEEGISHLTAAVEATDRPASLKDWSIANYNLGRAYSDRVKGPRTQNIDSALRYLTASLDGLAQVGAETEWAHAQQRLAEIYLVFDQDDLDNAIELSISASNAALGVFTEEDTPREWSAVNLTLGVAFDKRVEGERTQNLESAIRAYESALRVLRPEINPIEWGSAKHNLGTAYLDRIEGEQADNLKKAITHLEQALQTRTKDVMPDQWANSHRNLGIAFFSLAVGDRSGNLERAISHFGAALRCRPRRSSLSAGPSFRWVLPLRTELTR